jgi:hypothetical protein
MGYQHRIVRGSCGKCKSGVAWNLKAGDRLPVSWDCRCGTTNHLGAIPMWPDLPKALYIGADRQHQFKVYPTPPELPDQAWAFPYSIRSFVAQASREFGGCVYEVRHRGAVLGEEVYEDFCYDEPRSYGDSPHSCYLIGGWAVGQTSCPVWTCIAALCQTEPERKFLRWYLDYAKDRHFPMLIPQVWMGIAERRRPDFVLFVPLQFWRYKKLAIQLDAAHPDESADQDELRDQEIAVHGYEVRRIRPEGKGYLDDVRALVEEVEALMRIAEDDIWKVAFEVPVKSFVEPRDDVPF